tara:strand:+ start:1246 stop:1428 length:183 start_codon:yes stop_codon:yes gene_type:complete
LIYAFVLGFVTNRLVNHQDIITGNVKEGHGGTVGDWVLFALGLGWYPAMRVLDSVISSGK